MYDVLIIGAGIVGASVAREFSRYNLKIAVLEKDNDVADETTKANSAIVHSGYDARSGSLMAKYNVLGNAMYEDLCKELSVPFKRNGSLVIAFNEDEMKHIETLYKRGLVNGVPELSIISKEDVKKLEPNISDEVVGALYAKTAGIVSPWELTEALMDNAIDNGVELFLNTKVLEIEKKENYFVIKTNNDTFETKIIINCSGVYTDLIHNMVAPESYKIFPRSGEYFVLDKTQGARITSTIFQCPSELGKGVLVAPTIHGNLLVGPDSIEVEDRSDISTNAERLEKIKSLGSRSVKDINFRDCIRNFSGVRSENDRDDFIIEESSVKGFFDVAGIKSPGLTSAPAIAIDVIKMVADSGLKLDEKSSFVPPRKHIIFMNLSPSEKAELIKQNPAYGRVICRCEMITEGEIIDAIHRPVPARTLDAVKKRSRPGMGRCQGGFCGPRVQEIISRELNIPLQEVVLAKDGSYILTEETKK
ncbi:NAD(P)/FAD-dependent oxidoreductase [Cetobacterium sp. 2A]|uniref:NAD(P)/FAD-dependent oxidoreductase n=1 Tax=Cetobacterium sp. 2A TaxID=2754723 RepID=UPI00163BBC76|nr:NAD(P)/FAD-dependent oxidoreductase [Cetobacterium sp. 2A]MBC2855092.1 NAD(P)/FAD-dependent oxidoreductase [Cetobacterium sp. 2A]